MVIELLLLLNKIFSLSALSITYTAHTILMLEYHKISSFFFHYMLLHTTNTNYIVSLQQRLSAFDVTHLLLERFTRGGASLEIKENCAGVVYNIHYT